MQDSGGATTEVLELAIGSRCDSDLLPVIEAPRRYYRSPPLTVSSSAAKMQHQDLLAIQYYVQLSPAGAVNSTALKDRDGVVKAHNAI